MSKIFYSSAKIVNGLGVWGKIEWDGYESKIRTWTFHLWVNLFNQGPLSTLKYWNWFYLVIMNLPQVAPDQTRTKIESPKSLIIKYKLTLCSSEFLLYTKFRCARFWAKNTNFKSELGFVTNTYDYDLCDFKSLSS